MWMCDSVLILKCLLASSFFAVFSLFNLESSSEFICWSSSSFAIYLVVSALLYMDVIITLALDEMFQI